MTDATVDTATTDSAETEADTQGSPEALGDGGKKALDSEREARKQADKDARAAKAELKKLQTTLQEIEDRDKPELEKAATAASRASADRDEALRERDEAIVSLLRFQVAAEKGLTGEAVELLSGSSREELESRADAIVALIEGAKPKGGPHVPEEGKTPEGVSDADVLARQIMLGQ